LTNKIEKKNFLNTLTRLIFKLSFMTLNIVWNMISNLHGQGEYGRIWSICPTWHINT
jgi:hypothetical protein